MGNNFNYSNVFFMTNLNFLLLPFIFNPVNILGTRNSFKKKTGRINLINMYPTNIYLFKLNNKNNRKTCEICSKLTIKVPE